MGKEERCRNMGGESDMTRQPDYNVPHGPVMPKIGVLGLVPDNWGGPWQSREHVLTRLASYFHVVWFNQPLGWREHWLPSKKAANPVATQGSGKITVYNSGRWLPKLYRPTGVADYLDRKRFREAVNILRSKGCEQILLYIWRPEFGDCLDKVEHDFSFYHIDDEYSFSAVEHETSDEESALIRRVDQVFIHSPALLAKKGHLNPNTLYVTNGVDYHAFARSVAEPDDLKAIPHPRIGYIGFIKDKLDFDLIRTLAQSHPEWSFVFVGPKQNLGSLESLVVELERLENVYFLGFRTVEELPGYAQHFDVCTLCYLINDYTKYIFPMKLNEYLAAGRPVVGVPIPSIELFSDVIKLAASPRHWSEAIRSSLGEAENSAEKVLERKNIARNYDWGRLTALIARTMCERMGATQVQDFDNRTAECNYGFQSVNLR